MDNTEPKTRRYDVLADILQANDYQGTGEKRAEEAKRLLSNYSGMTPKLRKGLEDIGFVFDESNHQKVKYYRDDRYTVVYASTPSDKGHGGKNNAGVTAKRFKNKQMVAIPMAKEYIINRGVAYKRSEKVAQLKRPVKF